LHFVIQRYQHNFAILLPEITRVLKTRGVFFISDNVLSPQEELKKEFKLLASLADGYATLWGKK